MANEVSLAVGDGTRRMTYAELAQAKGISVASARRLVRRHGWPRQVGNDGGIVRVLVPLSHLVSDPGTLRRKSRKPVASDAPGPAQVMSDGTMPIPAAGGPGTQEGGPRPDPGTDTLAQAVAMLREQLALANDRAMRAEDKNDAKDVTIAHLRERIDHLMTLLIENRRPWWRRWFR
jgi:hypothetical protein